MAHFNIPAFVLFALITCLTPGPNNFILLFHSQHSGIGRTFGLMAGMLTGFLMVLLASMLGVSTVFSHYPALLPLLKTAGSIWLIYLAVKMRRWYEFKHATLPGMGFWYGMILQPLNPKTWLMAIGALTSFAEVGHHRADTTEMVLLFILISSVCMVIWMYAGERITFLAKSPVLRSRIGTTLFVFMLLSVGMIWVN